MIKKYLVFLYIIFSVSLLSSQIVGESVFGNNANGNVKDLKKIEDNRAETVSSRSLLVGSLLLDQSQLVNFPGQGASGSNVSATTGEFFGLNANQAASFLMADDFIILPGEKWDIDYIAIYNYQTGSTTSSTINEVRMQVTKGSAPGNTIVYGDLTTNRLSSSTFSNIYRTLPTALSNTTRPIMKSIINTPGLSLFAGSYWVEHGVLGSPASGPWSPLRTTSTSHTDTGNAYQYNGTWNLVIEKDINGSNALPKGLAFEVFGTSTVYKIAEVDGIQYNTLADAIQAVNNDGDVITLLNPTEEATITVSNFSFSIEANGYTCKINDVVIPNGKYLKWIEDTLQVTSSITNNSTGTLWNNGIITIANFNNTGKYKGSGNLSGNFINGGMVEVGN